MKLPEFMGQPLSLLTAVTSPDSDLRLWAYGVIMEPELNTPAAIDKLIADGYQQVPRYDPYKKTYTIISSLSQLASPIATGHPDNFDKVEYWLPRSEYEHATKYPVILSTVLDISPSSSSSSVGLLQFLPPPTIGEYALIHDNGETFYNIAQLPEQSQELWERLNVAIRTLAAPGQWVEFSEIHRHCASELNHQREISAIRMVLLDSDKQKRAQAKIALANLESAHTQVVNIRQSWLKPDWLLRWREIKDMAQQISTDYYVYHQSTSRKGDKSIPDIADVFNMGVAPILTHQPFQAYQAAMIAHKKEWYLHTSEQEHDITLAFGRKKPSGTTLVQLREQATNNEEYDKVLDNMWKQVKAYNDLDSDVYDIMLAQLLSGEKDEEGYTWLVAAKALDYRGLKPKKNESDPEGKYTGGHRWEKIEEFAACIKRMENVWIKINEQEIIDDLTSVKKRKRGRTTISRESRMFIIADVIYHNQLPLDGSLGKSIPIAWRYKGGSWMQPFLDGSNRVTGLLFKKVLNYDPYHQKWAKRLGKFFIFWLRTNAAREKKPAITIGELIKETRLDEEVDERNPQRTVDRFEKGMNQLEKDGILIWHYKDNFELPARKWLATWLQQKITVENPPLLKSQYMSIEAAAKVLRTQQKAIEGKRSKKKQD